VCKTGSREVQGALKSVCEQSNFVGSFVRQKNMQGQESIKIELFYECVWCGTEYSTIWIISFYLFFSISIHSKKSAFVLHS